MSTHESTPPETDDALKSWEAANIDELELGYYETGAYFDLNWNSWVEMMYNNRNHDNGSI